MSQVNSIPGVINTASNSNNNNSTWNRTPGKPGFGGGGCSAGCNNTTNADKSSVNHLHLAARANPSTIGAAVCGPGFSAFDRCSSKDTVSKTSTACSGLTYSDDTFREQCSTSPIGCGDSNNLTFSDRPSFAPQPIDSLEPSQMWPPPIFESTENGTSNNNNTHASTSNFASHPDIIDSGSGQWSISSRAKSIFTDAGQANVSGVWSMDATSNVNPSGPPPSVSLPRAITGQLHQQADSLVGQADRVAAYLPGGTISQQSTAATVSGWSATNLSESSQLFAGDQSTLPSAFPKLNLANPSVQSDCFQPIHDYSDDQHLLSTGLPSAISNPVESALHLGNIGSKGCDKKSSIDGTEVDTVFSPDPEDAIQAVVNTTEAWGTNPIDQSSPWDLSDLVGSTDPPSTQQPPTCSPPPSGGNNDALTRNLFDCQSNTAVSTSSMPHQRRITAGSLSGSSQGDCESNVWPREPPNGTGIWETHYESLGERTARWQQNSSSNPPHPQQTVPGHLSSIATNRSHLTGGTSPSEAFRGYPIRPNTGISPLGHPLSGTLGSINRPLGVGVSGGPGQLHLDSLHANGSSRNFPMPNSPVLGNGNTAWFRNNSGSVGSVTGDPKVGRWPGNSGLGRISNKQQQRQHSFQSMLSGPGGTSGGNPRWSSGWLPTDPRRGTSDVLSLRWSSAGGTGASETVLSAAGGGYYGVPSALHPLLPSPSMLPPPPRSLRPPYPSGQQQQQQNTLFLPTQGPISTHSSQRTGLLSTQQHHLQQQSMLRANAMRQLVGMGFSEDEVQAIFSDLNTNVTRALLDLRERTCHSGLDDIIRMFTNANSSSSGFAPISSGDELCATELTGSLRPISARSTFNMSDQPQQPAKVNYLMSTGLPPDNVETSLVMLQQRETQILQTIMQLHVKHQELKMAQLRQTNFQFTSGVNPVMQELQLQAVQIAQQIEAQQAQLKHVRSQAGMLKQLAIASPSPPPPPHTTGVSGNPFTSMPPPGGQPWLPNACLGGGTGPGLTHSMSAFVGASPGIDLSAVGGGTASMTEIQQLLQQMTFEAAGAGAFQDQQPGGAGPKMGSGSFLWESGPWSGPGQPGSQDGYPSLGGSGPMVTNAGPMANDRRSWTSANRAQMTGSGSGFPSSLGSDPRWIMDPSVGAGGMPDDDYFTSAIISGGDGTVSRHWLLVHNIPPHMSVSVLKTAVASALAKSSTTGEQPGSAQLDFELHPNMLARWVLLGLNSAANANLVLEYIDAPSANGAGGHYGCVKAISPMEAFQCLQDIQSLACPFKISSGNTTTAAAVSSSNFLRSGSVQHHLQSSSQIPFSAGAGVGGNDFSVSDNVCSFSSSSVGETGASING